MTRRDTSILIERLPLGREPWSVVTMAAIAPDAICVARAIAKRAEEP